MNTTGSLPLLFARSTCRVSRSVRVDVPLAEPIDGAVTMGGPLLVARTAGRAACDPVACAHSPLPAEPSQAPPFRAARSPYGPSARPGGLPTQRYSGPNRQPPQAPTDVLRRLAERSLDRL